MKVFVVKGYSGDYSVQVKDYVAKNEVEALRKTQAETRGFFKGEVSWVVYEEDRSGSLSLVFEEAEAV